MCRPLFSLPAVAVVMLMAAWVSPAFAQTYDIVVSDNANRSNPSSLDGATVAGDRWIFTTPTAGVEDVFFYLDGDFVRREKNAPFDLAGGSSNSPSPLDTTDLSEGEHTVTALLVFTDNQELELVATFTVMNIDLGTGGPPAPEVLSMAYSTSIDRSNPIPLDGANPVSGEIAAFLAPEYPTTSIISVKFYLDDPDRNNPAIHVEQNAPYDFLGDQDDAPIMLDTATLTPGEHVITARVKYADGSRENFQGYFIVVNDPDPIAPALGVTLSYSLATSRANSKLLANATVSGNISIFISPAIPDNDADIDRVVFYLDDAMAAGTPHRIEGNAPYDFNGGDSNVAAFFDSSLLSEGIHIVTAHIEYLDGRVEVIHARFNVANNAPAVPQCDRIVTANVVALDQVFFWNRLGAVQPHGMMYALYEDIEAVDANLGITPGNVQLRTSRSQNGFTSHAKRPRPITLRMNVGDCLRVNFTNLLNPTPVDNEQVVTRSASVHVVGMQLVNNISDDGSFVGTNNSSLAAPGETRQYMFTAEREGSYVLNSTGAMTGGEGNGGQLNAGLFGCVCVEPKDAEWYRSQVTRDDLQLATNGFTPQGHPLVDYNAVYPNGHPQSGRPIFKMLDNTGKLRHSDLTAIITGPNRGNFSEGTYLPNPVYPRRNRPFREFAIIYHDEPGARQAFPQFADPILFHTLHSVRDAFAINYGTGGIGSEILANRLGVGPMWDCTECKYEEFFLTSWVVGDPAQVVDVPANVSLDGSGIATPGPKATKVLYPDDPSNVYHSYLSDHVKFRIMHGGSKEHHIHHQHAHQWVYSPDSDNSAYLDSQAIGPSASFTLEMAYDGSGNRNQTVGDSIFHCHFYPHFAQGMWAMWRVHDVFERGTQLNANGIPVPGSRAYPDGEIGAGTPIPTVVPIPGLVMPPMPEADVEIVQVAGLPGGQVQVNGAGNPGYPFFVPGVSGHRPPHPPLDTVWDGGLPRHVITGGETIHFETRLDFTKELEEAVAEFVPETGTAAEEAAMDFHAQRFHSSFRTDGTPGSFLANGSPPAAGAPFADPCIDDFGNPVGNMRVYKAANVQIDAVLNKAGWHFPQLRILSLWEDVLSFVDGSKPPEPLFFRANSDDCIEYHHTNLVPNIYELDDFQVRTPTDVLGQHIHLVKFDVTASDGAGNGWNYEDGTFSPDEVRERIRAIRAHNNCIGDEINGGDPRESSTDPLVRLQCPVALPHPFADFQTNPQWLGAQTTIQRWYADSVLNFSGEDRTLRTVYTHDHYAPSTQQHTGLYAGLLIEPKDSTWIHPETGAQMGSRADGGPTSFQAIIQTPNVADSYREFMLEYTDFQLAYRPADNPPQVNIDPADLPSLALGATLEFVNPEAAVNAPGGREVGLPFLLEDPFQVGHCPMLAADGGEGEAEGGPALPCPEAISADDPGSMSVNYRMEPIALRVHDPNSNMQAAGAAGDLANAFRSDVVRANPLLNVQPTVYPPLTNDVHPGDPFTPLLRSYEGDKVQIRTLVGGQEEGHNLTIHGVRWLFEPDWEDSGYRNSQMQGISEHFEYEVGRMPAVTPGRDFADYLYKTGGSVEDQWNGTWGLMRTYKGVRDDLLPLPNNLSGQYPPAPDAAAFVGPCPADAPVRTFHLVAAAAADILPGGSVVYNSRTVNNGPLTDPTGLMFVRSEDLDSNTGQLLPGVGVEPLVLRANAGDCIEVTLENRLPNLQADLDGFSTLPPIVRHFNANQIRPSSQVGLHANLLHYDVATDDGVNAGFNELQTAQPGEQISYRWYAGKVEVLEDGSRKATPIEYGSINLTSADPIKHSNKGLVGAMVIEPQGSSWTTDPGTRTSATVFPASGDAFREFVLVFQNDLNLRHGDGSAIPNLAEAEDAEDSGQKGLNYRTEPTWFRFGFAPDATLGTTRGIDMTQSFSNAQLGGGDPETPVFTAAAGTPVRFRVTHPAGHQRNEVFAIHGHVWQQLPFQQGSTVLGTNLQSLWEGSRMGHGPTNQFDVLIENGAGGKFQVPGDYLFRDMNVWHTDGGLWGLFRVTD